MEVDEFGGLTDESVFITLSISHWPESARRLVVENTVELIETEAVDHTHVLDGQLEFSVTADARVDDPAGTPVLNSN